MKILVTGFMPFNQQEQNPSWLAVQKLPRVIENADIIKLRLPYEFNAGSNVMKTAIRKYRPDFIISVGQAAGRQGISIERIAINVEDARKPDNAGFQPYDFKVHQEAPTAYLSTLPIKNIERSLHQEGFPAKISNSAGTHVSNAVMFTALHYSRTIKPTPKCGFIHIPLCEYQTNLNTDYLPTMTLDDISACLEIAVKTIIAN